jgi:hypothetical protein
MIFPDPTFQIISGPDLVSDPAWVFPVDDPCVIILRLKSVARQTRTLFSEFRRYIIVCRMLKLFEDFFQIQFFLNCAFS